MLDLAAEITDYIAGERGAVPRGDVITWIMRDASAGAMFSVATSEQWGVAIDEAIKRGLLIASDGSVRVAPVIKEPQVAQLSLF